jgi:hypothetical protein
MFIKLTHLENRRPFFVNTQHIIKCEPKNDDKDATAFVMVQAGSAVLEFDCIETYKDIMRSLKLCIIK